MKITRALRKEINAAVRRNVGGAIPLAEVGLRGESWLPNALNWTADDDLGDLRRLADLSEIDDCAAHSGRALLDLYVTTGRGMDRELETNVYVAIADGRVVAAHHNGLRMPRILREIGFPLGAWMADGEEEASNE